MKIFQSLRKLDLGQSIQSIQQYPFQRATPQQKAVSDKIKMNLVLVSPIKDYELSTIIFPYESTSQYKLYLAHQEFSICC